MTVWTTARAAGRAALDLLLPASCAGCGDQGAACCPSCAATLAGRELVRRVAAGTEIHALARYDGVPRRLVLAYKERGRRDLARPLGAALAAAVPYLPGGRPAADGTWWLVPAPSRRSAARARGGQHVHALARRCAAELAARGVPAAVAPALRLGAGARDAVGLGPAERVANLAGRVRARPAGSPPPGTPVVLLDDVVTTGATAVTCANALRTGGAEVVATLTLTAAG
ncbi:putative amidophosphoribosyltransferase [Prauserella shujinwangii]|uniref:Putative amidophosphoribosyltransferase n=1 Tax=Prauserella shujinwangii TaxID=1453103 RepID=A0A2T0LY55_9PSEU|nr:ComF family protein [Prauserella shujinwangii]PRX49055.1 putative amidophosphoribosyltransferase [Prauserella shujinwangii]